MNDWGGDSAGVTLEYALSDFMSVLVVLPVVILLLTQLTWWTFQRSWRVPRLSAFSC
ncbi:hypothetical protein [Deinococcus aquaticus]|uniref:hypothetical protein n=1 Tax=Deinococcus aquaticus TaxID=328692 RepID=UPI003F45E9FA